MTSLHRPQPAVLSERIRKLYLFPGRSLSIAFSVAVALTFTEIGKDSTGLLVPMSDSRSTISYSISYWRIVGSSSFPQLSWTTPLSTFTYGRRERERGGGGGGEGTYLEHLILRRISLNQYLKVVHVKQVFHFNRVHINKVLLFFFCLHVKM